MLFLVVILILGFLPKQNKRYWMLAALAFAIQNMASMLFYAGGTLEDPSGDGYITAWVRQATQDGPEVLWVLPFAMGLGWVLPIFLVYKGYKRKEKSEVSSSSH
jgi:hypothetical protein